MAQFAVNANTTNATSTTTPLGNLFCTLRSMPGIYEINMGSDASADNAAKYAIQRSTARGTQAGTSIVPQDVSVTSIAPNSTYDIGWSGALLPTLSATAFLLQWGQHQRGTYRWVAYDYTKLITASTSAGLALMSIVVSSPFNAVYNISFQE